MVFHDCNTGSPKITKKHFPNSKFFIGPNLKLIRNRSLMQKSNDQIDSFETSTPTKIVTKYFKPIIGESKKNSSNDANEKNGYNNHTGEILASSLTFQRPIKIKLNINSNSGEDQNKHNIIDDKFSVTGNHEFELKNNVTSSNFTSNNNKKKEKKKKKKHKRKFSKDDKYRCNRKKKSKHRKRDSSLDKSITNKCSRKITNRHCSDEKNKKKLCKLLDPRLDDSNQKLKKRKNLELELSPTDKFKNLMSVCNNSGSELKLSKDNFDIGDRNEHHKKDEENKLNRNTSRLSWDYINEHYEADIDEHINDTDFINGEITPPISKLARKLKINIDVDSNKCGPPNTQVNNKNGESTILSNNKRVTCFTKVTPQVMDTTIKDQNHPESSQFIRNKSIIKEEQNDILNSLQKLISESLMQYSPSPTNLKSSEIDKKNPSIMKSKSKSHKSNRFRNSQGSNNNVLRDHHASQCRKRKDRSVSDESHIDSRRSSTVNDSTLNSPNSVVSGCSHSSKNSSSSNFGYRSSSSSSTSTDLSRRTRSRSASIPRRRGSPSFLERRRITSARKRPIPYKRSSILYIPSSSSSESLYESSSSESSYSSIGLKTKKRVSSKSRLSGYKRSRSRSNNRSHERSKSRTN